ncbi:MAG: magnesium transporter, partial [Ruminococcaceae bacterium]|nr:magnesium transporter [Oscillospiraceae bacterium]
MQPPQPNYSVEITDLIRSNLTPAIMRERLQSYHESDLAESLELLSREERGKLYHLLDTSSLADVLDHSGTPYLYLPEVSLRRRAELLSQLETDVAADCLRRLEKPERNTLLELMDQEARREILLISSFDEDEIGSRMSANYIAVQKGLSVRQAMKELVAQAAENDNISTIFVVDETDTLVGAIDLKDLIIARDGTELSAVTVTSFPYVYANELIEDCIERLRRYSEESIPVLDADNKLKGVLTSASITELVGDELGDDYAKLAGLSAEEDLREPVFHSIGK